MAADEKLGTVKIADEVIAMCVMNAVMQTEGVSALFGGISDSLQKNILGKQNALKGIKVYQSDEGIVVDINVIVEYGVKIPAVAWDIQENVKQEIENVIDGEVKAINIHVQGVHFNDGDTE